jgi:hypothetical protein
MARRIIWSSEAEKAIGHLTQIRFNVRPEITIFELEKA